MQTLTGVTADQANQAAFKYSFATAIAGLLSIPTSSVVIKTVSGKMKNTSINKKTLYAS